MAAAVADVPAGLPGVRAEVGFDRVALWRSATGREPVTLRHAELGHVWLVMDLVDSWEHDQPRQARGRPVLTERYVVSVDGPLPGQPGRSGRFLLEVCSYGHLDGWWLIPLA